MKVIALIRRTIDGVTHKPGDRPFDLDDDLARELIEQGVVADANPPKPVAAAEPEIVEYPLGYEGRQTVPGVKPAPAPEAAEPVTAENPTVLPADVPAPEVTETSETPGTPETPETIEAPAKKSSRSRG